MNKERKKHIKILAEKFNHKIEYDRDIMVLKNSFNEIRIWTEDKYGTNISFNKSNDLSEEFKLKTEDFYNVLIEILGRKHIEEKLMIGTGILLTIKEWISEEGEFANEQLEGLKIELNSKQIEYKNLGGNRFFAEYFKGVLILTDDFCWGKSNVISI